MLHQQHLGDRFGREKWSTSRRLAVTQWLQAVARCLSVVNRSAIRTYRRPVADQAEYER